MKKINFLIIIILFLFLFIFPLFVLGDSGESQVSVGGENIATVSGDVNWQVSEDGSSVSIFFKEEGSVKIANSTFYNVEPESNSYIKLNSKGEIVKMEITQNDQPGSYVINGISFNVPPHERFFYDNSQDEKGNLNLPEGSEILSLETNSLNIKGKDIKLPDGLTLVDGSILFSNNNYIVNPNTNAIYRGFSFNTINFKKDLAIFQDSSLDSFENCKGNCIQQVSNGEKDIFKIKSSKEDAVNLNVLEGNKIFNVKKHSKLNIDVKKGSSLEILKENGKDPSIKYFSGTGDSEVHIETGGLNIYVDKENGYSIDPNLDIKLEDIYSEKILSVPFSVEGSQTMDDEGKILSNSKLIINDKNTIKLIDEKGESKAIFTNEASNTLTNLIDEQGYTFKDLQNLADFTKKNILFDAEEDSGFFDDEEELQNEFFSKDLLGLLDRAKNIGFSKDQSIKLSSKLFENAGKDSRYVFDYFDEDFLSSTNLDKRNFNFLLKTIDQLGENNHISDLGFVNDNILKVAFDKKLDLDLVRDYLKKGSKTDSFFFGDSSIFFADALSQYDGSNFESIKQGIGVISKFYPINSGGVMLDYFNLDYSQIKNKESLSKQFANSLNNLINKEGGDFVLDSAEFINKVHDSEESLYKTDFIRDNIIKNLDFEAKYKLLSYAGKPGQLYPSSFDKIFKSLPEDFVSQIKEVDPDAKLAGLFSGNLAKKGKLGEVISKDPSFFMRSLKNNLNVKGEELLFENVLYSVNVLDKYYQDPEFKSQKEELEIFLSEKYKNAEEGKEKATYAYLIKLDENPINKDLKELSNKLPDISSEGIPQKFLDRGVIASKLYFYGDENSFGNTKKNFNKLGFNVIKETNDEVILEKKYNSKTLKVSLKLTPEDGKPDNDEDIESDEYQIIAHRGHCYHNDQTFSKSSLTDKIFYLGGCNSYDSIASMQYLYPKAQIVSLDDIGHEDVNNEMIYNLLRGIADGKSSWKDYDSPYAKEHGIVLPNDKSVSLRKYVDSYYYHPY